MGKCAREGENFSYDMSRLTLLFVDPSLEKEFRVKSFSNRSLRFKIQSIIAIIVSAISCIAVICLKEFQIMAIPLLFLSYSMATFLVLILRRGLIFSRISLYLALANISLSIVTLEYFLSLMIDAFYPLTNLLLIVGANALMDMMNTWVTLWPNYFLNVVLIGLYFIVRTSLFAYAHSQPKTVFLIIIIALIYLVIKASDFYLRESQQRYLFIQIKVLISKQKMWRFVLDEVYPQSTFLIDSEYYSKHKEQNLSSQSSGLLKKLSTFFFDKELPKQRVTKKKNSEEAFTSQHSFYLDYSPTKTKKNQLHVRTVEEMYEFLQHIEVVSTVHPHSSSSEISNNENKYKNLHEIIQDLFHGMAKKERNLTIVPQDPENIDLNQILQKKEFNINYLQQRKKKKEMKSVLVKGFYHNKKEGEHSSRIAISLKLSKFAWEHKSWVLILFQDISEHEENKTLKELDRLKDKLLASVTHDLRTPLNMVIVMIDNARSAANKRALNECLDFAEINAKLLSNLICDILDYSLFKENKMRMIYSDFSLSELLSEITKLISFQLGQKKIALELKNGCSDQQRLYSDSQRLKQILINLLTNSIKFTSKGAVTLIVEDHKEYNTIKFKVKDTGTGIKPENKGNLFRPFETFDTEDGLNKQGIGLGLYICKNIVAQLGPFDQLFLESVWGTGTKIEFYIFKDVNLIKEKRKMGSTMSALNFPLIDSPIENKGSLSNKQFFKDINSMENSLKNRINLIAIDPDNINSGNQGHINTDYSNLLKLKSKFPTPLSIEEYSENKNFEDLNDTNPQIMEMSSLRQITSLETKNPFLSERFQGEKENKKVLEQREILPKARPPLNLLIVDDNVFNIFILENYLKKIEAYTGKINMIRAYTGLEALEYFRQQNDLNQHIEPPAFIDLILMDCEMPTMNGYEATIAIKQLIKDESHRQCLIAACTSYQGKVEQEKCLSAGMDFFLVKPVSQEELFNLMKSITI